MRLNRAAFHRLQRVGKELLKAFHHHCVHRILPL
jgi:hypothetical protein